MLLKPDGIKIDLQPIHNSPHDAGLIGATHLAPPWIFEGHDGILAVDKGGTNMHAGVVTLNLKKASNLSKAFVWERDVWRHADDKVKREDAIDELAAMLQS